MSVTKLRESTQKKGCMITVWVVMGLALVGLVGTGFWGCLAGNPMQEGADPQNVEVFSVEGQKVTLRQVNEQIDQIRNRTGLGSISDPTFDFQFMASAISELIAQAVTANLAAERNVVVDDAYALRVASDSIDASIGQMRSQLIQSGDLKADATEAEFQKILEERIGMSAAEFKEKSIQDVKDRLANPDTRPQIIAVASESALQENYIATTQVTDEEVKKSYETYSLLSISFDKQDMGLVERQAQAEKAMEELRGGADFLAVQKKYTTTPNTEPTPYNRAMLEEDPKLKPLASLKVGDFSQPIVEFGAIPRIYKLVSTKSDLPNDYATNKAVINEGYRRQKAGTMMQKAVAEAAKTAEIDWKSPGYEAVYRVLSVNREGTMSPEQIKTELRAIIEETNVAADDPAGSMPAILARYMAVQSLEFQSTEAEKKELAQTKIEVVTDLLNTTEHTPLRLELVDTYLLLDNKEMASQELLTAAMNNTGLEMINQSYFDSINTKLVAMETAGTISEENAKKVRAELVRWSQEKAEADRLQKEQDEELNKFTIPDPAEEAAKKALDEANKPKETTTTGGN